MAYSDLDGNTQGRINNIATRVGKSPQIVMQGIDIDITQSGNGLLNVIGWYEDAAHDAQLRQLIAQAEATNSGGVSPQTGNPNGGGGGIDGSVGMPTAPPVQVGGNLVSGVNTRYGNIFAIKQKAFVDANVAYQTQMVAITQKNAAMTSTQNDINHYASEAALWLGRHHGCGPFSAYGCGDADNNVTRAETSQHSAEATLARQTQELAALTTAVTQFLRPQLDTAKNDLNAVYAQYSTDVAAAIAAEQTAAQTVANAAAAAQQTANNANPAYWAQKAIDDKRIADAAAITLAATNAAALAKQKTDADALIAKTQVDAKAKSQNLITIAVIVAVVAICAVVGIKFFRS